MNQGQIISIGSINADFQVRIKRRPATSETLLGHDFVQLGGGKAANVAYLARRLDVPARLIAHIGDDALSEQALKPLQDKGVDLSYVRAIEGCATGVAMITVPPDGKKGIIMAGNANDHWLQADTTEVAAAIKDASPGSVLVVDYEVPDFIVEQAINSACAQGFPVILDPSPAERVKQGLFPRVDYLVPNDSEAQSLTNITIDSIDAAIQAGRLLVEQGIKNVCLKLADGGCVVVDRRTILHIPAIPMEVVDTTGAGDAFAGGLAVAILEGRALVEVTCFAVAASHLSVTRYGSQPAYPTRDNLNDLCNRLLKNTRAIE